MPLAHSEVGRSGDRIRAGFGAEVEEPESPHPFVVHGDDPEHCRGAVLGVPDRAVKVTLEDGDVAAGRDVRTHCCTPAVRSLSMISARAAWPWPCCPCGPTRSRSGTAAAVSAARTSPCSADDNNSSAARRRRFGERGSVVVRKVGTVLQGDGESAAGLARAAADGSDRHAAHRSDLHARRGRAEVAQKHGHLQWLGQPIDRGPHPVAKRVTVKDVLRGWPTVWSV